MPALKKVVIEMENLYYKKEPKRIAQMIKVLEHLPFG